MRYLLVLLLAGCTTVVPPVPVPLSANKNREDYVNRLEYEASEAAAALLVAKKNVEGKGKPLIDLTETRLSGIKKPTAEQVVKFESTLASTKALETEQTKAKAVDAETTKLYEKVAKADKENEDLRNSIVALNKEKEWTKVSDRFLLMAMVFGFAGAAFIVANTFIGKGLRAGVIMFLLSSVCAATPFILRDVVEAEWFRWAFGSCVVIGMAYGLWCGLHTHKEVRSRLLPANQPIK